MTQRIFLPTAFLSCTNSQRPPPPAPARCSNTHIPPFYDAGAAILLHNTYVITPRHRHALLLFHVTFRKDSLVIASEWLIS